MEKLDLWSEIGTLLTELFTSLLAWTRATIATHAPGFLAAVLTLFLAWLLAVLLRNFTAKLLRAIGLDVVAERSGLRGWLRRHDVSLAPSAMLGWLLYSGILFTALVMAFDRMQLDAPARLLRALAASIPKLVVVFVILALGISLARWAGGLAGRAARLSGISVHALVAALTRVGVVLLSVVVALDYLQLASPEVLLSGLGVLAVAGVLAAVLFAVCARDLIGNLVARNFVASEYRSGSMIRVAGLEGEIESVGTTAVRLRNGDGSYRIPNSRLLRETVLHLHRDAPAAEAEAAERTAVPTGSGR